MLDLAKYNRGCVGSRDQPRQKPQKRVFTVVITFVVPCPFLYWDNAWGALAGFTGAFVWTVVVLTALVEHRLWALRLLIGAPLAFFWPFATLVFIWAIGTRPPQ